jgi:hypothetical protein
VVSLSPSDPGPSYVRVLLILLGVFSVSRVCSRTWIWPACVTPAKNHFMCESIVQRDWRTRDMGRWALPWRTPTHADAPSACVRVPTTFVPILESDGAHHGRTHRIVLMIVNTVTQPVKNWNSNLRVIRSVKFYACGPILRPASQIRKSALSRLLQEW